MPPFVEEEAIDPDDGGGPSIPPVDPDVSIVFVIDSSESMFPRIGPNYFDLARRGLIRLLDKAGFPIDETFEIAVIQFTQLDAPNYSRFIDMVPLRKLTDSRRIVTQNILNALEPSVHHSASLLEMGIREATDLLMNESAAVSTTDRHIIIRNS